MFPSQETTYAESKYVANILTSMASGEPATPNSVSFLFSYSFLKTLTLFKVISKMYLFYDRVCDTETVAESSTAIETV